MRLIANRQLCFGNTVYAAGEEFDADDAIAIDLMQREVARRALPPTIVYETKPAHFETPLIVPEVTARQPFRDMSVSDAEPQDVAAESNPVLPESDLSKQGTPHPGRRRGRKRFGAG